METTVIFAKGFDVPPVFLQGKVAIVEYKDQREVAQSDERKTVNQYPLTLRASGIDPFTFPIDPLVSVSMKNIITRRQVAKGEKRGTVKERWTEDDADITITGIMIGLDGEYPEDDVAKLQAFFKQRRSIDVECTPLNDRGIHQIAVESLDLPHTKGSANQAFSIKAYSDDADELLAEG